VLFNVDENIEYILGSRREGGKSNRTDLTGVPKDLRGKKSNISQKLRLL